MFAVLMCSTMLGHALPDDFYDRGIHVTLDSDQLVVRYEVTCNDRTLNDLVGDETTRVNSLQRQIARGITVEVNGVARSPTPRSFRIERRHHTKAIFIFELPYELHKATGEITVCDRNFAKKDGVVRWAVVGRDRTTIENANAPSTLQRSQPIILSDLCAEERNRARTLQAVFRNSTQPNSHTNVPTTLTIVAAAAVLWLMAKRPRTAC